MIITKGQRKLIAGCYARLSDDDEKDGTSVSIETQKKILMDFCRQHGIQIYDFYCDDGYTGTNFDRPDFKRMMQDARDREINVVIVKDLSRFGRNYLQVGSYMSDIFPEMGIRFIAIGDDVDTDKGSVDYDLMVPIKNVFNEYYPADCSKKTKQAFIAKASNGEYIGSFAKYGYQKNAEDKHVLELNDEVSGNVVWMFEMAAYQGFGYLKLANTLKARQILTPAAYRAKQLKKTYEKDPYDWNVATVYGIMNDETYLGFLISGKRRKASFKSKRIVKQDREDWIVVPGVVPQLISQQLWDDAHSRLDTRKRTGTSGFNNIFAGLIKCDKCGYALGIANAKSRENFYMCNTYKKKGPTQCSSHYILYRELYQAVLTDINEMLCTIRKDKQGFIQQVLQKIDDMDASSGKQMERECRELEKRIAELDRRFDRLYDDRLEGLLSDRKFKEMSAKCENEQEEARSRYEILMKKMNAARATDSEIRQFIDMVESYDTLNELNAEVLNRLVESIVIGDRIKGSQAGAQKIIINYRFAGQIA